MRRDRKNAELRANGAALAINHAGGITPDRMITDIPDSAHIAKPGAGLFRFLLLVLLLLAAFCSCAQREPEEEAERHQNKLEYDRDAYREAYLEREDQEGFVGGDDRYDSKYGFAFPEIDEVTEGFVDYRGTTVSFPAPYEGQQPDYVEGEDGDIYVLQWLYDGTPNGIVCYHADGSLERICTDPDCTPSDVCTHNMTLHYSYVQYWRGNLYFSGERWDAILDENGKPMSDPVGHALFDRKSYIMRYDIAGRDFHKVIEFLDSRCSLFVIRDGVLYIVSGEEKDHYFSAVDLEAGEACRSYIGRADVYGILDGQLVIQRPSYGKSDKYVEYNVILRDEDTGKGRTIATYTHSYAGAAGDYVIFMQRWENGGGYDLCRQHPWLDHPEVVGRDAVKCRMDGDRCFWLCSDGTLWRTNILAYNPKKIDTNVIDFSLTQNGTVVYLRQKSGRFRGTSEIAFEQRSDIALYFWSNFHKQKVWESGARTRYYARAALGENFAFLTCFQPTTGRVVYYKVALDGSGTDVIGRRKYGAASVESWAAYHTVVWDEESKQYAAPTAP